MKQEAMEAARAAYAIESDCIAQMADHLDMNALARAVELLAGAQRIGAAGCGHSGIACRHFAHLMCALSGRRGFCRRRRRCTGVRGICKRAM